MQQEVQAAQAENARLAEGFKTLATNSSQLTQEIRENTALAPNTIFSDFVSNRVEAGIYAARTGFVRHGHHQGQTNRNRSRHRRDQYILPCATCRTRPLTLWDPGTDWDKLTRHAELGSGEQVPIHRWRSTRRTRAW